jgi:hypothetical protein
VRCYRSPFSTDACKWTAFVSLGSTNIRNIIQGAQIIWPTLALSLGSSWYWSAKAPPFNGELSVNPSQSRAATDTPIPRLLAPLQAVFLAFVTPKKVVVTLLGSSPHLQVIILAAYSLPNGTCAASSIPCREDRLDSLLYLSCY